MRFRGFEFEDQPWFPGFIRDSMTDYLRFLFRKLDLYKPVLPILEDALAKSGSDQILDLCSGSGGAVEMIYENLKQSFNPDIKITLSDLFPSELTYDYLSQKTHGGISYINTAVDACSVPNGLNGLRTIFSGFHHFEKKKAKEVLKNAVEQRQGIAIFDGGNRSFWMIILIIVANPVMLFLCTPFFKPFRLSRLIFTYLIPVIPFCTVWDGVISILRLYSPDEMLKIALEADNDQYTWISGKVRNNFGMSIAYLVGYPKGQTVLK
jgi:ubiquinone/menaquinone biosynthesis C-methylase UbiE